MHVDGMVVGLPRLRPDAVTCSPWSILASVAWLTSAAVLGSATDVPQTSYYLPGGRSGKVVRRAACMDDELALLQEHVSRFAERELLPHVERWERDKQIDVPSRLTASEAGLLGAGVPEEYSRLRTR